MTRHEIFTPHPTSTDHIATKELVLATDLDGTFLGGSETARARLYRWIEANRDEVGLIFVTGRDPRFIRELTNGTGVPRPEFVVGDVGTTIAEVAPDGEVIPIPIRTRSVEPAAAANTTNGSRDTARMAGTESTANTTSVASMRTSTTNSGVAIRRPLWRVNSFWPS